MATKKTSKAAERIRTVAKKVAKKVASKAPVKRRAKVQPIPKGYHVITPSLVVRGAAQAIEFYKKAFGAKDLSRMNGPDGKVLHAEIKIGDSIVMLGDEFPNMGAKSPESVGGTSSSLMIYTRDVDALFNQAVAAGAKVSMPVSDMFWGDRYGTVIDPFGHQWQLATHKEDITPKEMARRAAAAMSGPPQNG
ncbi:VOC family protein [Archangium violaceum]|uniref:VOC family protein n=1 Tax=Archangium violaceum TaxID=83451 RepID=UPI001951D262|nr:VOC family protein [Archangium violaceum]QRN94403.1 VOC family protein [Archangium violaceum]